MSFESVYSVIGAVDVPTDAQDPNTSTPPASRVFLFNPTKEHTSRSSFVTVNVIVAVADGTSLAVEVWVKDEGAGRWWLLQAATVASGTVLFANAVIGALTFVRVKTNTGNVKNYMVGIR
jgi:hypothetical protein